LHEVVGVESSENEVARAATEIGTPDDEEKRRVAFRRNKLERLIIHAADEALHSDALTAVHVHVASSDLSSIDSHPAGPESCYDFVNASQKGAEPAEEPGAADSDGGPEEGRRGLGARPKGRDQQPEGRAEEALARYTLAIEVMCALADRDGAADVDVEQAVFGIVSLVCALLGEPLDARVAWRLGGDLRNRVHSQINRRHMEVMASLPYLCD